MTNRQPTTENKSPYPILGKMAWLWMNSPLHTSWSIEKLAEFTLPAIELRQYLLLERNEFPVAYCSWAFLNKESEIKYIFNATRIENNNWNCGNRLWFIDWVTPFSDKDSMVMKMS